MKVINYLVLSSQVKRGNQFCFYNIIPSALACLRPRNNYHGCHTSVSARGVSLLSGICLDLVEIVLNGGNLTIERTDGSQFGRAEVDLGVDS